MTVHPRAAILEVISVVDDSCVLVQIDQVLHVNQVFLLTGQGMLVYTVLVKFFFVWGWVILRVPWCLYNIILFFLQLACKRVTVVLVIQR